MRTLTALGLTVLRLLTDRPQHTYELQQRMREQGLDQIVKVTHGALHNTVDTLAKAGLIESVETVRDGRRPNARSTRSPRRAASSPANGCASCWSPSPRSTPPTAPRWRSCHC